MPNHKSLSVIDYCLDTGQQLLTHGTSGYLAAVDEARDVRESVTVREGA